MRNKAKPLVSIELDKKRNLLLDLNAMVNFEEATGKNILQGASLDNLSAKDLRALLWACLLHEDKDLTLEQVGEMIHGGNMESIANKLTSAWEVATPEGDKEAPLAVKSPPG